MASVFSLVTAEQQLLEAIVDGDVVELDRLLDDLAVYLGPDGVSVTKEQDLELYRSGQLMVESFAATDLRASTGPESGSTVLEAILIGTNRGSAFRVRMRYTRQWILSPTGWRVASARGESLPDPEPLSDTEFLPATAGEPALGEPRVGEPLTEAGPRADAVG